MDEKTIEIEVLIEFKEYLKLAYVNFIRKMWFVFSILPLFYIIGFIFQVSKGVSVNDFLPSLPFLILPFALLIVVYWSAKRNMKTSPVLKRASKYQFSENRINVKSEIFDSSLSWENIIKAQEKANIIILYTTQNAGFFLPVRCFENESQIVEFKELVRRKLGNKAKLSAND
jgi:YcxB-like protein